MYCHSIPNHLDSYIDILFRHHYIQSCTDIGHSHMQHSVNMIGISVPFHQDRDVHLDDVQFRQGIPLVHHVWVVELDMVDVVADGQEDRIGIF